VVYNLQQERNKGKSLNFPAMQMQLKLTDTVHEPSSCLTGTAHKNFLPAGIKTLMACLAISNLSEKASLH